MPGLNQALQNAFMNTRSRIAIDTVGQAIPKNLQHPLQAPQLRTEL
jgi:hypothetical protein